MRDRSIVLGYFVLFVVALFVVWKVKTAPDLHQKMDDCRRMCAPHAVNRFTDEQCDCNLSHD